jgi:hypothetical protein
MALIQRRCKYENILHRDKLITYKLRAANRLVMRLRPVSHGFTLLEMLMAGLISVMLIILIATLSVTMMKIWQASSSRSNGYLSTQAVLTMLDRDVRNAAYVMTPLAWSSATAYSVGNTVQDSNNSLTYTCTTANGPTSTSPSSNLNYWKLSSPWVIIYRPMLESAEPTPDPYLVTTLHLKINHTPLQPDMTYVTEYYLSNSTAVEGAIGTNLYVRYFSEAANGTTTLLGSPNHPLMTNVTTLTFTYTATQGAGANQQLALQSMAITTLGQQDLQKSVSFIANNIAFRNSMAITFTPPTRPTF